MILFAYLYLATYKVLTDVIEKFKYEAVAY